MVEQTREEKLAKIKQEMDAVGINYDENKEAADKTQEYIFNKEPKSKLDIILFIDKLPVSSKVKIMVAMFAETLLNKVEMSEMLSEALGLKRKGKQHEHAG